MEWLPIALGVISPVSAMVFAYVAFSRNKRKDDADGGQQNGVVLTEIGYIKSGIDDIKLKQARQEEKQAGQHVDVITRLAKVEASASQAHKRLDTMQHKQGG